MLLVGSEGSGKTELALQIAKDNPFGFKKILYAVADSKTSLERSFDKLCKYSYHVHFFVFVNNFSYINSEFCVVYIFICKFKVLCFHVSRQRIRLSSSDYATSSTAHPTSS